MPITKNENLKKLKLAIMKQEVEQVKRLVKLLSKDILNTRAPDSGFTPLHIAASKEAYKDTYYEIIQLLIDAGADSGICDNKGKTVLNYFASAHDGSIEPSNDYLNRHYHKLFNKMVTQIQEHMHKAKVVCSVCLSIDGTALSENEIYPSYEKALEMSPDKVFRIFIRRDGDIIFCSTLEQIEEEQKKNDASFEKSGAHTIVRDSGATLLRIK